MNQPAVIELERHLTAVRDGGRKLLVPYVTGGFPDQDWVGLLSGLAEAGADAVEVGIPFSDPVMDGVTIQEASQLSLRRGTTPNQIIEVLASTQIDIPVVIMCYYNTCFKMGEEEFATKLAKCGVSGAILPDLSLEDSTTWRAAAKAEGVATVMLAAPTTGSERMAKICEASTGFVYGVGTVGVTGERKELSASARVVSERLKAITQKPVLIGVGVSSADQGREACEVADGVIVGSALVRTIIDSGVDAGCEFIGTIRAGLDAL